MNDREHPFSVRLLDTEKDLEFGHALAGESKGEFTRRAIQERAERFKRDLLDRSRSERSDE